MTVLPQLERLVSYSFCQENHDFLQLSKNLKQAMRVIVQVNQNKVTKQRSISRLYVFFLLSIRLLHTFILLPHWLNHFRWEVFNDGISAVFAKKLDLIFPNKCLWTLSFLSCSLIIVTIFDWRMHRLLFVAPTTLTKCHSNIDSLHVLC